MRQLVAFGLKSLDAPGKLVKNLLYLLGKVGRRWSKASNCFKEIVTLGIRPEDIRLVSGGEDGGLRCEVIFVETVGSDKFLGVRLGTIEWIVRTAPHASIAKRDTIDLSFGSNGRTLLLNRMG